MKKEKNYDFSTLLKKEHSEKWIALSPAHDKILGYADDLLSLTTKMGDEKVVYMKAMSSDSYYAF